jgi:hypothetical protein
MMPHAVTARRPNGLGGKNRERVARMRRSLPRDDKPSRLTASHQRYAMNRARTFVLTIAALVAAACSTTTEPLSANGQLNVTATYQGDSAASILPLGADAVGGQGSIVVMGHIRTPTPCYDLSSRTERDGTNITVTIAARATSAAVCAQVIVVRSYTLRVGDLTPGSYRVKVIYEFVADRTERETKLEKIVQVN